MKITILDTHLFPDRQTLSEALDGLSVQHALQRIDTDVLSDEDAVWDEVVNELLTAELVVSL